MRLQSTRRLQRLADTLPMRRLLLTLIAFGAVPMLLGGCRKPSCTSTQDVCATNLIMIEMAARAFGLQRKMPGSATVDPQDLVEFFKGGQVPVCPLGTERYRPFALSSGPVCPNCPDHTGRFRQKWGDQLPPYNL
ncbi:exported hypothetical protein [Verrucomicrobia bacterium]|nr:exported hypothetical protein [Verrucomicrobiota bacterium]